MTTTADIGDRVAALVGRQPGDALTLAAAEAAWQYVAVVEGVAGAGPGQPAPAIPNDPAVVEALVGFTRRVYLDSISDAQLADLDAGAVFAPEDIYRHHRHSLGPLLTASWGIA